MTTDISVGVRWDPLNGQPDGNNGQIEDYDFEYDGGNSSSRLFERSRIRALAGEFILSFFLVENSLNVVAYVEKRLKVKLIKLSNFPRYLSFYLSTETR